MKKGIKKYVATPLSLLLIATQGLMAQKTNIVFVVSDDHSMPFLGCFGAKDIKTPNLDKFASEGVAFSRAYVTSPQSAPSRSSFFTGRSPISTSMTLFSLPLPSHVPTYPDILRQNGYFVGVTARSHHQDGLKRNKEIKDAIEKNGLNTFEKRFDYHKTGGKPFLELKAFLDKAPKDKPFFVQVSFYDPHRPWDKNAIAHPHNPTTIKLPDNYPDNALIREDFARHYDEISRMDNEFGMMIAELDRRGIKENTIVVFVGDNGSALLRGKGTLYELGINIPLLIRWPAKIKNHHISKALISGEDLAPTLLSLVGLNPDKGMTGIDFSHILTGKEGKNREWIFSERAAHAEDLPISTKDFDLIRCVVCDRYKLIYNALRELKYWPVDFSHEAFWLDMVDKNNKGLLESELSNRYFSSRPMFELYDLENDPQELVNLSGKEEYVETEKKLMAIMAEKMLLDRDYVPLPFHSLQKEYK